MGILKRLLGAEKEWPFLTDGLIAGMVGRELEVYPENTYWAAKGQLQPGEHLYVFDQGQGSAWGVGFGDEPFDEEHFSLNTAGRHIRLFALSAEEDEHYSPQRY